MSSSLLVLTLPLKPEIMAWFYRFGKIMQPLDGTLRWCSKGSDLDSVIYMHMRGTESLCSVGLLGHKIIINYVRWRN